jgi:hypothetical protein
VGGIQGVHIFRNYGICHGVDWEGVPYFQSLVRRPFYTIGQRDLKEN